MIHLALLLALAAQQIGTAQQAVTVRSAAISGTVVDEAGRPVERAWLGVTSAELPGARTTISGDDGRFVFTDLPAGRFRLYASKPSYLTTEFGQRAEGDLSTIIRLTEGQRLSELQLRLPRMASIRGRFVDETGKAIALHRWPETGLSPEARRRDDTSPRPMRFSMSLDGQGGFKVERLRAGTYTLRASPRSPVVEVTLTDGQQLTDVVLSATKESAAATTSVVEGDVTGPDGVSLKGVEFRLVSLESDSPDDLYLRGTPRTDDGGHFEIANIPVGRYMLIAKHAVFSRSQENSTFRSFWASSEVTVAENIKAYVRLALQPGVTVRGQVLFDGKTMRPPPFSRVAVNLVPQDGRAAVGAGIPGNVPSEVSADGRFAIWSVPPGRYKVDIRAYNGMQNLMEGWSLESALLDGSDVLDLPLTVADQDVSGIAVRLTDESAPLEGTTRNAAGDPAFDSTVVVFPVDARAWSTRARKIRAVRPDTSGMFLFPDLPSGDYYVAAVAEIEPQAWFDPTVLSALSAMATRVSVAGGAAVRVVLTVR